jgi:hypothetical protein
MLSPDHEPLTLVEQARFLIEAARRPIVAEFDRAMVLRTRLRIEQSRALLEESKRGVLRPDQRHSDRP